MSEYINLDPQSLIFNAVLIADKYQIIEALDGASSGKFGQLYKGIVKETSEPVLIKALAKSKSDQSSVNRLRNEVDFSFDHQNLPSILDFYESETEVILVRNYVEGETLKELWLSTGRKGQINLMNELINKMKVILDVFQENEVIHGDIRPGNIIVSQIDPLEIHLIDFGLAFKYNNHDSRKVIFPLGFAAPELILNQLEICDSRTDIYALGITIWNLFTGELPLAHPNPSIFTNLQITHPLPDHSRLPKGLHQILNKMCAKYSFQKPPNKMKKVDVIASLKEGIRMRYYNLEEVISELDKVEIKWSFYQRISLR